MKMTGSSASAGTCAISSTPSLPGSTRSSSTSAGRSASEDAGEVPEVARRHRVESGPVEGLAREAQRPRVVVDDEYAGAAAGGGCAGAGRRRRRRVVVCDRQGEGDKRSGAGSRALGADATAMRLDDALADGEPETAAGGACARGASGVLAEKVRQLLRGDAVALVGNRQLDVSAVERGGHPDRRRRRVAGGVGEQVAEHLDDAGAVGHHARQVRRQIDGHVVAGAPGQERAARRVDERARVGRLGIDRQGAGVDTAGVEQVADEVRHPVGLVVDDAEELHELRNPERAPRVEHSRGGALDGGERHAQLVAHHAEEVGAHAVELLERGEVLKRDHNGLDPGVAAHGGGAEQRGDAGPVGHGEHDLLGPYRLRAAQRRGEGELAQRQLAPVGAPAGNHIEEVLGGVAGLAQALDDAPRLAVERDQAPRRRIEHRHADRGGVDQGFEVGARAALVAEGAGVGDGNRGLRGEQHEQFLVARREAGAAGLLGQREAADVLAELAHRRALAGAVRQQAVAIEAERAEVRGQVREADGTGQV
ncbi:MAG: hypothetical protein OXG04_07530, partial [Acidobacteria bacterium]|nr:hypothetical protein [Acidobacteriota bacterium]